MVVGKSAELLEPRLPDSYATVVIPLDHCIVFVRSLNSTDLPRWPSEVAQTLDPIPRGQFVSGGGRRDERWSLGTVYVRRYP